MSGGADVQLETLVKLINFVACDRNGAINPARH